MISLKMQPTFTLDAPDSVDGTVQRIRRAVQSTELREHVDFAGQCFDFKIGSVDRRFWSPHLSVHVSETEAGSQILGRFSPRPEIWTMFMAIYAVVAFGIFAAAIFGYVQWALGSTPLALIVVPVGVVVIACLHTVSLVGQSLSSDQMQLLRERLDQAIDIGFEKTR